MGLASWASVGIATVFIAAGCGRRIDPLAGTVDSSQSPPTIGVEIVERPTFSVVATATTSQVTARAEPAADSPAVVTLDHPKPNGAPLVFQVVDTRPGWLQVRLPVRPNGSTGWLAADEVELSRNPYRLEIDVSAHQLLLWDGGDLVLDTVVAIGTGATPTPIGDFYLTELLQPPDPSGPYGTYAFGLSGFSETLRSFNGGEGVVGLHGTNDPSSLGSDVSHGCVRLANEVIDDLAGFLPLGTPVAITT